MTRSRSLRLVLGAPFFSMGETEAGYLQAVGGRGAPAGNAAARLEPDMAREKREAMPHQIQRMIAGRVTHAPLVAGVIPGFAHAAPYEDLKLKR